ncbi:hypothetical protein [Amycolatopsis nigrescens]|uniref:hypothetical protein n=1 Tax=Amycolatopsis nigrescens TaxID=381445 RepID=UPI00037AECF4|nr:hypothetical protein [Amycolatopsis nigrescens]
MASGEWAAARREFQRLVEGITDARRHVFSETTKGLLKSLNALTQEWFHEGVIADILVPLLGADVATALRVEAAHSLLRHKVEQEKAIATLSHLGQTSAVLQAATVLCEEIENGDCAD